MYHQSEAISQSLREFRKFGLVLSEHGNRYQTPHNRMPFADVQAIMQFLKNLATTYATSLPGRLPGHKHKALPLQPHMTKRSVYHQYVKACSDDGSHISVGQSLLSGWS